MNRTLWWLVDQEGARHALKAGGILLGRAAGCDFVLTDPRASRSQALVYINGRQPRLLVLGKGRTLLNDGAAPREAKLGEGDRVTLPGGVRFEVASSSEPVERRGGEGWVLAKPGGELFGISYTPFVVGGHANDDVRVDGFSDHAVTFHLTHGRLLVSAKVMVEVDGAPLESGALVAVAPGSQIARGEQTLRVVAGGNFGAGSTVVTAGATAASERVELEFLPRGGRLRVHTAEEEQAVYLPGQRCDLMALLLQPPEPYRPGDLLDDDLVLARVWPSQSRTRIDLNTLIHRLRRDLVRAGIDGTAMVVRAMGGGATRLGLSHDTVIRVA